MRASKLVIGILVAVQSFTVWAASGELAAAALRRSLGARADWTMIRQLGDKGPKLSSSGTVECIAGRGIVWRVTAPFASTVTMTTNAMIFADEEDVRVKPLAELPYYAEFRERADAFAAGNDKAFDELFENSVATFSDNGWRFVLKPRISAVKRLFLSMELSGASLPTNVVMKTADGGSCIIRFAAKR